MSHTIKAWGWAQGWAQWASSTWGGGSGAGGVGKKPKEGVWVTKGNHVSARCARPAVKVSTKSCFMACSNKSTMGCVTIKAVVNRKRKRRERVGERVVEW